VTNRSERGVTLIELMIAITLVAALSTGMLMAMRTGLLTLQKVDDRLQANRRVMTVNQILSRQIGGVMPILGACGPVFNGNPQTLRLASTYSMSEGSRGEPRLIELVVVPGDQGSLRLIVNEFLYSGPFSTTLFCGNALLIRPKATPESFVLADRLASCRILYKESRPDTPVSGDWLQVWNRPNLPAAVRVEMVPLFPDPARLPLLTVTVPLHINREVMAPYADSWH
jgi:prepilin-type N-terminal cleavage/methylation domain-containing protein